MPTQKRKSRSKPKREKPLSASHMKPDEILKIMLKTPPLPKEPKTRKRKNKAK